jgi:hydrogenase maturation protease
MILVACIGNIFLGDDGFGVEVARELSTRPLAPGVVVKDFGIRGFDLAYALLDHQGLTILVDACPRGGAPGSVYLIEPDTHGAVTEGAPSAEPIGLPETHSMNPMRVFEMVRAMGGTEAVGPAGRILLVGCEPADFGPENEGRMGLSDPVQAAVYPAVAMIERLIQEHTERREDVHGIEHTFIER